MGIYITKLSPSTKIYKSLFLLKILYKHLMDK